VSYAELGKCGGGAVKIVGGVTEGCLGHSAHKTMARDESKVYGLFVDER